MPCRFPEVRPRKPSLETAVTFRVSALAKERLAAYAAARGLSMQEAARLVFESLEA